MWWASTPGRASHPNAQAPRCLPCDFDDSQFDKSKAPFNAPKGCPCTAQLLCETDERGIFNKYCDVPKAPLSTYSMHGGAGGIISIGMLRAVSLDYMEKCVKSLYSTGTVQLPCSPAPWRFALYTAQHLQATYAVHALLSVISIQDNSTLCMLCCTLCLCMQPCCE